MTRYISILIITICLFLCSCSIFSNKKTIPEGFSKLTVIVDDSSNFYLDKVFVKNSEKEVKLTWTYDTVRKKLVYAYDSLRNNEYQIILVSLVNRHFATPLTLIGDTTIFISKSQMPNFDTLQSVNNILTDLQQRDTACIAYTSFGCFHHYSNKMLIYKKGNDFIVEFSMDTSHNYNSPQFVSIKKEFPADFSDTLRKLEQSCMEGLSEQQKIVNRCNQMLSKAKDGEDSMRANLELYNNTTSSTIYISKGNKVFMLSNNGINEIPYRSDFMKALKL